MPRIQTQIIEQIVGEVLGSRWLLLLLQLICCCPIVISINVFVLDYVLVLVVRGGRGGLAEDVGFGVTLDRR